MDTGVGAGVASLLAAHGDKWTVSIDPETKAWTATERDTGTALHIIVGPTLSELRTKLDALDLRDSGAAPG